MTIYASESIFNPNSKSYFILICSTLHTLSFRLWLYVTIFLLIVYYSRTDSWRHPCVNIYFSHSFKIQAFKIKLSLHFHASSFVVICVLFSFSLKKKLYLRFAKEIFIYAREINSLIFFFCSVFKHCDLILFGSEIIIITI